MISLIQKEMYSCVHNLQEGTGNGFPRTQPTILNKHALEFILDRIYNFIHTTQCCGSGMFIPDPEFYPSQIRNPTTAIKEENLKLFNFCTSKANFLAIHYEIQYLLHKILSLTSQNMGLGSGIRKPRSGKTCSGSRIQVTTLILPLPRLNRIWYHAKQDEITPTEKTSLHLLLVNRASYQRAPYLGPILGQAGGLTTKLRNNHIVALNPKTV